jgi:mannose-1-phosphate guanylyltransferase
VLLGIEADAPAVQYGGIEPGEPVLDRPLYPVYRVRQFWEKPDLAVAERLLRYRPFMAAWHARSPEGDKAR